jgi:16S rRNA (guanine(1405)-N(7))-methyltransferase
MTSSDTEEVARQLGQSGKYATLCPATLQRIAAWALARHPRPKDAVKAGKRKLHQVFGAYLDPGAVTLAERQTAELGEAPSREELEAAARDILRHHASSDERLAGLRDFYAALWDAVGEPRHVLDLACGFSPFALPFMGLAPGCRYDGVEIDLRLATAADRFRALARTPGEVRADDILVNLPPKGADVVLLLKTLPCLDQQETGAAQRVLARIDAPTIVVSYPVRSLGGRDKGMASTYRESFLRLADGLARPAKEVETADELVFVLT